MAVRNNLVNYMANTIKFNIDLVVDGKRQVVQATTDVRMLGEELARGKKRAADFGSSLQGLAQISLVFNGLLAGIQSLTGALRVYTEAYSKQIQAEQLLSSTMQNTMGASEAEVQSIKDLASAQQELGVVGDEVQLAGAKELAVHVKSKAALEALIPVMNDLAVKQAGLNVTSTTTEQVAQMMGKALEGQVGALRRQGIFLTAAQEQTLKFGSEMERVEVLAEALSAKVGGLNAELAKTDAGKAKQAANAYGDWEERVGALVAPHMQLITVVGNAGMAAAGAAAVISGLAGAVKLVVAACSSGAIVKAFGTAITWLRAQAIAASTAFKGLNVAIKGALIATGVGAAIVALTAAIEYFVSASEEATEATEGLKSAEEAFNTTFARVKGEIDQHIKKLKELKDSNQDATAKVAELNKAYGDHFGVMKTASEWYNTLVANSERYCTQLALEAKALALRDQIAQKSAQMMQNEEAMARLRREGKDKERVIAPGAAFNDAHAPTAEYAKLTSEQEKLKREIDALNVSLGDVNAAAAKVTQQMTTMGTTGKKAVKDMTLADLDEALNANKAAAEGTTDLAQLRKLRAERRELEKRQALLKKAAGLDQNATKATKTGDPMKGKYYADPKDAEQIEHNLQIARKKLTAADTEENKKLRENIALWEDKKDAIELAGLEAKFKSKDECKSLDDVADSLDFLEAKRKKATGEDLANVNRQIKQYETLGKYLGNKDIIDLPNEQLSSFDQLNTKLSYYNDLLNIGSASERAAAQQTVNDLEKIRNEWQRTLAEMDVETDVSKLRTLEEIERALSVLQARRKRQSVEEIAATDAEIAKLERKREAMERGGRITGWQKEVDDLRGLGDRELTVKVRSMGFEQLTEKIRELKKEMEGLDVTDDQRKSLQKLIDQYEQWRRESVQSMDTVKSGWAGLKGIGDGVKSLTDALQGNGDAWSVVTGVIDAAFKIYDSISGVIGLITMLTEATSTAKKGEAAAQTEGAAAAVANVGATAAQTAASAAAVPALEAEAASWVELAAARIFAAHAMIPFVGPGLATGFVTGMGATIGAVKGSVMALAEGGVAYGPQLALVGEYRGASSNPEVVAPLDKLRSIIEPAGGTHGDVEFRIQGRTLVGILNKENKHRART